ncbi:MAG: serine/threonine protein kinase, partial [Planctomycetes bacterium]|nr:serine/threonine protein kinase [Planctomycetota bacterium]
MSARGPEHGAPDGGGASATGVSAPGPADPYGQVTRTWDAAIAGASGPRATLRQGAGAVATPPQTAAHRRVVDPLLVTDGDYRLGPVIGEGGMGTVSRALQRALGRQVALKRLRPEQAGDPSLRARFLAEAALTADLAHPQVIPVHDLGTDADGMPFYTMKLVSGRPWDEVMHLLDLEQNLRILLKVCDAVGHAHSKGVLHRDLKPDNIMVGDFGEVLVLDWGLAAAFAPGTRAPRLGPDTPLAGTPAYMPPECALGETQAIGPASDVYLLGALLHVLLTGQPPHPGGDANACLLAAAGNIIDPPPPPDALGRIAAHAMATRPEDRHGDVQAFQQDLRGWREHRDSLALAREARLALARAMQSGSHQLYSDCVHGCEEALRRWEGNHEARTLLATARRTWALAAAARGDFALAESQLD